MTYPGDPKCVCWVEEKQRECDSAATRFISTSALGPPDVVLPFCEEHMPKLGEDTGGEEVSEKEWREYMELTKPEVFK